MKLDLKTFAPALLGLQLFSGAGTAFADESKKTEPYVPTIRLEQVVNFESILKLDTSAPDHCERARDICLFLECGSFKRRNVTRACWDECTNRRYEKCKVK